MEMTYQITADADGNEQIGHSAGGFKAMIDGNHFFGRDALREVIEKLSLKETETLINGQRRKVFHNDKVAITMTKDPWQDYPRDENGNKIKTDVFNARWGGRNNPLRPGRPGTIRIIGDKSAVFTAFNLMNWRMFKEDKTFGFSFDSGE